MFGRGCSSLKGSEARREQAEGQRHSHSVCGLSDGPREVSVLDHVLDATLELSYHEDDEVNEEDLPNDGDVEERDEGQKEGDE